MVNTSATGGPLVPSPPPAPQPIEGQALQRALQQWIVGILGIDPTLVRPRWQTEPPDIPGDQSWVAFGVTREIFDTFPALIHGTSETYPDGYDELRRNTLLTVLCSFYGRGAGSDADALCATLRDGLALPQNSEALYPAGMILVSVGEQIVVPSLLKETWLYRVDLDVTVGRLVVRDYPVLNLESAEGTLTADPGDQPLEVQLEVQE